MNSLKQSIEPEPEMIRFETYCEDYLDMHIGLMSAHELSSARAGYKAITAPKPANSQHPDMKRKAGELKTRCERLVIGQRTAVERCAITDPHALAAARLAVAEGERLLAKRSTKAEFIMHAEMNADASRAMNAAR